MIISIQKRALLTLCSVFGVLSLSAQIERHEGVSIVLPQNPTLEQVEDAAVKVRPSYRQLDYENREMLGFIHIGMNTFTGREWGTGKESPDIFNPAQLDADAWVKTFRDAGLTGVILVAKHHDGFCMWPSRWTDHSVSHSPWRNGDGDLVRDVANACHKYNMKFCLYLSPWDMHEKSYGTTAYNDYYIHQLEELLTNYGPVYLLWFDGAGTSSDVSGHVMPFDWPRIFSRARALQPDVLLSGNAPDIRWVGNEAGKGRTTEWCVQGVQTLEPLFGSLDGFKSNAPGLGALEQLSGTRRLVWYPSRGGLPLRKGWFYNSRDDGSTKSLSYLVNSYFSTVGCNSNLLPNLSPDTTGRIPVRDAARLIAFGKVIEGMKRVDYAQGASFFPSKEWVTPASSALLSDSSSFTSWHTPDGVKQASVVVRLAQPSIFDVVKLQENVRDYGQRIARFAVDIDSSGVWREVATGTTMGFRRMLRLSKPVHTSGLRIRILDARRSISLGTVALYKLPEFDDAANDMASASESGSLPFKLSVENITSAAGTSSSRSLDGGREDFVFTKIPGSFVFCLDGIKKIAGLTYVPFAKSSAFIDKFDLLTSIDGVHWDGVVDSGRFGNVANNPVEQYVDLGHRKARYVKLVVKKLVGTGMNVSVSAFRLR